MQLHEDFISSLVLPLLGPQTPSQIFIRIKVYQIFIHNHHRGEKWSDLCRPPDMSNLSKETRTHCVQSSRDYFDKTLGAMTRIPPRCATSRQWSEPTNQVKASPRRPKCHCPFTTNIQTHLSTTQKGTQQSCHSHHPRWNYTIRTLSTTWHNSSY